jgi:hypothetical protein
MNTTNKTLILSTFLGVLSGPNLADSVSPQILLASIQPISDASHVQDEPNPVLVSWFSRQLTQPSESQLRAEERGLVRIYDGLTDRQVGQAMDSQFERIQHMMFVRTVITDATGVAKTDVETGHVQVEDDGCD